MKKLFYLILIVGLIQFSLSGQGDTTHIDEDDLYPSVFSHADVTESNLLNPPQEKKQYSLNTGMSFINQNGNSYYSSWVMPSYNFNVSPRINVDLGVFFQRTNIPYSFYPVIEDTQEKSVNRAFVVTNASYMAGKKLRITGGYIGELTDSDQSMQNFRENYQQVRMGIHYSISENVHFQANFIYDNMPYYSPYSGYNHMNNMYYWPGY